MKKIAEEPRISESALRSKLNVTYGSWRNWRMAKLVPEPEVDASGVEYYVPSKIDAWLSTLPLKLRPGQTYQRGQKLENVNLRRYNGQICITPRESFNLTQNTEAA